MKTYLANIIPQIKKYSKKLDDLTLLMDQHWVVIDELPTSKCIYIFRSKSELLISQNGRVEKGKWEYLGNDSLLIELKCDSYLFRLGFFDSNILALKVDGVNEYAFLANEIKYGGDLNSIDELLYLLERKYIRFIPNPKLDNNYYYKDTKEQMGNHENEKCIIPVHNDELKYGYKDEDGELIIPYEYDGAYKFIGGCARVYKNVDKYVDCFGFIDKSGKEVIPLKFEYCEDFSEGLALARLNYKFGFIDKEGNTKIEFKYDDADSFKKGSSKVEIGNRTFFIDITGSEIYKRSL